jgi:serine/threonine protein phosphatase PrpC
MHLSSHGVSDIGRRRKINEDSFLSDDGLGLYIVADGVGGQAKGEIASAQAVEEVHGFVNRNIATLDNYINQPNDEHSFAVRRLTESAVQSACYMVFGMAELDPSHRGMSTTISALLLVETFGVVAQVGDSRVYRLRSGNCEQLTEDHTLINYKLKQGLISPEEAQHAPGKNVITRAVGHRDYVHVDTFCCDIRAGDRFMLCSDGLHGYVDNAEVGEVLASGELDTVTQRLVDIANERGGRDNITVLTIEAR